jgi:hypothetical protein
MKLFGLLEPTKKNKWISFLFFTALVLSITIPCSQIMQKEKRKRFLDCPEYAMYASPQDINYMRCFNKPPSSLEMTMTALISISIILYFFTTIHIISV